MIRDLVKWNDPILKEEIPTFDFKEHSSEEVKQICDDLVESIQEYKGLGLAANQIGLRKRVFILWTNPTLIVFNPRIVYEDNDLQYSDEACLSYPGVTMKIKRPTEIRVRFQDPSGNIESKTFMGFTAKAFHHETDHLNGITFFDRAGRYHKEKGLQKLRKVSKMIKRSGGVRPSLNTPHPDIKNVGGLDEILLNKDIRA